MKRFPRLLAFVLALLPSLFAVPAAMAATGDQFIPPTWVAWLFVGLALVVPIALLVWYRNK